MALKYFVKVSNISNLSDARYCAGMGVDMLGFNINPQSDNYVSTEQFKEISEWLSGVSFVGETSGMSVEDIKVSSQDYPLDYLQTEVVDTLEEISGLNIPMVFKLEVADELTLKNVRNIVHLASEYCKHIVISSVNPSLHEHIDREIGTIDLTEDYRLIKGYGIETNTVGTLDPAKFSGIQLSGTMEERPGFNDYGDLMDILELLEEED